MSFSSLLRVTVRLRCWSWTWSCDQSTPIIMLAMGWGLPDIIGLLGHQLCRPWEFPQKLKSCCRIDYLFELESS